MSEMQRRSFRAPDARETYPRGLNREVYLGERVVARSHLEPGWRWSVDLKPIVGTTTCRFHHTGMIISGTICWQLDDGTAMEFGPDDVFDVPPGHDTWVVGDEAVDLVEWGGAHLRASPATRDLVMATIVFTDICDSTALRVELGEAAWNERLDEHNAIVRGALARFRGTEVATTGDGFLAVFDGAERAVRAAAEVNAGVRAIDLRIRAAVHAGEIEVVPGNIRGVAVHVAARMLAMAGVGEILVSSLTRSLMAGSTLTFHDRGEHALRGVPEPQRLFAVEVPAVASRATATAADGGDEALPR